MDYISVKEFAQKYGVSERTARNYCASGKIEGVVLVGKTWNIPADATLPMRKSKKQQVSPLLSILREQKNMKLKGGIYHRTQIDLTYNSNHIEGSRLSHEQTRFIFETNTIGITDQSVRVDDIIETTNHFRCIDLIIEQADEKLTEDFIKKLHLILKSGTSDSTKDWFVVGDYKRFPNEVGGIDTCEPKMVHKEMVRLLKEYNAKKVKTLEDIIDFHQRFESIHPFQDGNGRVDVQHLADIKVLLFHLPDTIQKHRNIHSSHVFHENHDLLEKFLEFIRRSQMNRLSEISPRKCSADIRILLRDMEILGQVTLDREILKRL